MYSTAASAAEGDVNPAFEVVCVPIGIYQAHGALPADEEAARIVTLLVEFGAVGRPWEMPGPARTKTGVSGRLADWADPVMPRSSVLLWIGHGESNRAQAWLAVYETRKRMSGTGIMPGEFAEHIANEWHRRAFDEPPTWAVVVIEACGAERFVDLINAELLKDPNRPKRLALVGVGGQGAGNLGEFQRALALTLASYTDNDDTVRLTDLMIRLQDRIAAGTIHSLDLHTALPLPRRRLLPGTVTAPLDIYIELRNS